MNAELEQLLTSPVIVVGPWIDTAAPAVQQPINSHAVERFWLPAIGPTALLMARRWGTMAVLGRFEADLAELGVQLGVSSQLGRNAPVIRTIDRLVAFKLARPYYTDDFPVLQVRTEVGPPNRHHRTKWPAWLHDEFERCNPWRTHTNG